MGEKLTRKGFFERTGILILGIAAWGCKNSDSLQTPLSPGPTRQPTPILPAQPQEVELPTPELVFQQPTPVLAEQLQGVELPASEKMPLPQQMPSIEPSPPQSSSIPEKESDIVEKVPEEHRLFNSFLEPFIEESKRLRLERKKTDPEYSRRVDEKLNSGRVTFVTISRGITHEPPTEKAEIASMTIYSFDYVNGTFSTITLTHDLRAPEIERELMAKNLITKGQEGSVQKLDQAILNPNVGGFNLTRLVLEDATGLSIDFQIELHDTIIQRIVDKLFEGKLEVDVPVPVTLIEYYIGDEKFPRREFKKGPHLLTGSETVGFIKAIPTVGPGNPLYNTRMENAQRQSLVIDSILKAVKRKLSSSNNLEKLTFLNNLRVLVNDLVKTKELSFDFNPIVLIANNFGGVIEETIKVILGGQRLNTDFPPKVSSPYIVDPACSKEGNESPVHWVDKNHLGRPGEKNNDADLNNGVYPMGGNGFEVPFEGNPHGDLVTEYWQRVRAYIRKEILVKK